ncbi:circadian clock KaiB family protein [Desulfococcaceae bacterium HSG7]|nr:circadian clock KaiB family protein [Desulfococcaceae bacterium HSG7]
MPENNINPTEFGNSLKTNYELFYDLHLFIASNDPASDEAHKNLKNICETKLGKYYELQTTDINKDFLAVINNGVLVTPTLKITITPEGKPPLKPITIIGTLSDTQKVLSTLLVND